jgi:hypothetical protein
MPKKSMNCNINNGCGGFFYGLGFIGALVYNMKVATSFWTVITGILKAIVWPAFLVYQLFNFIGM